MKTFKSKISNQVVDGFILFNKTLTIRISCISTFIIITRFKSLIKALIPKESHFSSKFHRNSLMSWKIKQIEFFTFKFKTRSGRKLGLARKLSKINYVPPSSSVSELISRLSSPKFFSCFGHRLETCPGVEIFS